MADESPIKSDIQAIFKRLRNVPTNKTCFDCHAKNPTWASVTYGVFICIDCSAIHRGLGVHLSFVRSTQLDTNWTWLQIRHMQIGGNANAITFFRQHNCTTSDAQQKYNSRAAQLYKEKLHSMAVQAMRVHGTKLFIESCHEDPQTPEAKEVDFFDEHANEDRSEEPSDDLIEASFNGRLAVSEPQPVKNGHVPVALAEDIGAPSVEAALSTSPTEAIRVAGNRKPTIGQRKTTAKKPRAGLGAQKVKANFSNIEKEAQLADQMKEEAEKEAQLVHQRNQEDEEKKVASMRLAYQDLSLKQKKEEDKLRKVDPLKADQMERLGMGFGSRSGISHSLATDMKVIEQTKPRDRDHGRRDRDPDDDFEFLGFSSGPPKYKDSPFEDRYNEPSSKLGIFSETKKSATWENENEKKDSADDDFFKTELKETSTRKSYTSAYTSSSDGDAQKKFGNAKSISSDMYFGKDRDPDYRSNLQRFEGSSSISSADFFGNSSNAATTPTGGGSRYQTPDLEEVKESVRQGVTKVAGRLSNLASGVMSTLQDKYGY